MKGKYKYLLVLAAIAVVLIATAVGVRLKQMTEAPDYVFLYAENQPKDYPTTLGAEYFAELVKERTNGKIQILVKCEGELGVEKDIIQQLQYGGVDFARISLSQLAERIPEMNVLQMPYIYRDSKHMWSVLDGELGQCFMDMTKDKKMISLSWYDAGARNFYSALKPITCLEDVQGMKIRVQESALMADMITAMGGIPMKIEYEEVYSSLQRGIVDAAENNWSSYMYMHHNEVAGYFTVDEHTRVPELQLCSEYTWNKLTEEQQQIIMECAKESALYERELWKEKEGISRQEAYSEGVQIYALNYTEKKRFQEAMAEVYDKYCGEYVDLVEAVNDCR